MCCHAVVSSQLITFLFPSDFKPLQTSKEKMVRTSSPSKKMRHKTNPRRKANMTVVRRSQDDYDFNIDDSFFKDLVQEILLEIFGKTESGCCKYSFQDPALSKLKDGAKGFMSKMWWHVKGFQKRHRHLYVSVDDIQHFKFMEENMFIHRLRMRRARKTSLCDVLGKLPPIRKI